MFEVSNFQEISQNLYTSGTVTFITIFDCSIRVFYYACVPDCFNRAFSLYC